MIDERIKFRHLQCVLAVARLGSLQRAAETLAISQPAVSKTLKELEALLGVRLLERGRKGAELTAAGAAFARHAQASVGALRQAVASVAPGPGRSGITSAPSSVSPTSSPPPSRSARSSSAVASTMRASIRCASSNAA